MTDFAIILAQLEEAAHSPARLAPEPRLVLCDAALRAETPLPSGKVDDRILRAIDAYGVKTRSAKGGDYQDADQARPPRLLEREEALADLRRAEGSLDALRALRRRLAWLCHPDRRGKSGARQAERLLAEFNAHIDAAMTRARASKSRSAARDIDRRRSKGSP